ncbi:MAG: cytochrome c3 family protein [Desulfomonilaceae bacterium]
MQIRGKIVLGLVVVFSVTIMLGVVFAANKAPEGTISIHEGDVFKEFKQGPVLFPHAKHKALKCTDCHHEYKDGKNVWKEGQEVKKCSVCHKLEANGKIVKLEKAFHERCQTCHKKFKNENKPTGPVVCNKCHQKKK